MIILLWACYCAGNIASIAEMSAGVVARPAASLRRLEQPTSLMHTLDDHLLVHILSSPSSLTSLDFMHLAWTAKLFTARDIPRPEPHEDCCTSVIVLAAEALLSSFSRNDRAGDWRWTSEARWCEHEDSYELWRPLMDMESYMKPLCFTRFSGTPMDESSPDRWTSAMVDQWVGLPQRPCPEFVQMSSVPRITQHSRPGRPNQYNRETWDCALATCSRAVMRTGVHHANFTIVRGPSNQLEADEPAHIAVGIEVAGADMHSPFTGHAFGNTRRGWMWNGTSSVLRGPTTDTEPFAIRRTSGPKPRRHEWPRPEGYTETPAGFFGQGDVVGLRLDLGDGMNKGTLSLYLNGQLLGTKKGITMLWTMSGMPSEPFVWCVDILNPNDQVNIEWGEVSESDDEEEQGEYNEVEFIRIHMDGDDY